MKIHHLLALLGIAFGHTGHPIAGCCFMAIAIVEAVRHLKNIWMFPFLLLLSAATADDTALRATLTLPRPRAPEPRNPGALALAMLKDIDPRLYSWSENPPAPEHEMVWVRYGFGPWYKVKAFLTDEERIEFLKKIGQL